METFHLILTALSLGGWTALYLQSRARDDAATERNVRVLLLLGQLREDLSRLAPVPAGAPGGAAPSPRKPLPPQPPDDRTERRTVVPPPERAQGEVFEVSDRPSPAPRSGRVDVSQDPAVKPPVGERESRESDTQFWEARKGKVEGDTKPSRKLFSLVPKRPKAEPAWAAVKNGHLMAASYVLLCAESESAGMAAGHCEGTDCYQEREGETMACLCDCKACHQSVRMVFKAYAYVVKRFVC